MTTKQQIQNTAKSFGDEMNAARNYQHPDLSDEGLTRHRERLIEQVRAKYGKQIDDHRSALYIDRDRTAFDQYRPKLDWNNAGAVAKAKAKWEAVQTKLDAGLSIGQIIESADASTLAAINEFWTDHAEAQQAANLDPTQQYEAPDTTAVQRAVEDRAADLGGNTGRAALTKARQAEGLHAYAKVTLDHLDRAVAGQNTGVDDLHAALEAKQAEQQAMAGGAALIATHDANQGSETSAEPAVSE